MSTVITILIAVLVFGVIIFVHELGHFACAKWAGVRVNEFALGMGPTLWSFTKGETKYSLKAFPIGGFCAMEGEDEDSEDDRAFNKKPVWKRIVIDVAGAAMNLILGLIVVAVMVLMSGNVGTTTVSRFDEGNVSGQSGLQIGDEILRVNGTRTFIDNDIIYALLRDQDGVVDMQVLRNGEKVDLPAVKFNMTEDADGNKLVDLDFKVAPTEKTFGSVVKQTFGWTFSIARLVWLSLGDLITGNFQLNQLSGPVGVATAIGEAAGMGLMNFLNIVAFITINIGVFNLLPLPALDGGRLVFLIIEGIRRKPIKPQYEGWVHLAGLALLMLLMVFVTFNDIMRIFKG